MANFLWGDAGAKLTPEEIALQRTVLARRKAQGVDVSPIASPLQGIARVVDALGDRYQESQLNDAAAGNTKVNQDILASLLGSTTAPSSGAASALTSSKPSAILPASVPQTASAASIRQGLIDRGLPEHVADGFLVNFQDESGLNPGINEAKPLVPGSRGGFGLYQLTGPRRTAYESFAAQKGVDPSDVNAQLDFLKYELEGPEKAAGQSIMATGDTASAAQAIVNNFLRPSQENRDRRSAAYAGLSGQTLPASGISPVGQAGTVSAPQIAQTQNVAPTNSLGVSPTVIQALTNPYANKQTQGVAELLLKQQQGQVSQQQKLALDEQKRQAEIARRTGIAQQLGVNPAYAQDDDIWKEGVKQKLAPPSTVTIGNMAYDTRDPSKPLIVGPEQLPTSAQEYNFSKDNPGYFQQQLDLRRSSANNTTINNGEGNKFYNTLDENNAKTFSGLSETGLQARSNLAQVDQLGKILETTPTGATAALKQAAGEYGINTEGLSDIQAATSLINKLVPAQRQPGSGSMSDQDLALFKQSLPRLINQPGSNATIVSTLKAISQYQIDQGAIADRVANREMTPAEARKAIADLPNPLAGFKPPAVGEEEKGWRNIPSNIPGVSSIRTKN